MIDKLIEINEKLLFKYKNDKKLFDKHIFINRILKEENCFKKIDIKTAFSLLKDLGFKEKDLSIIYLQLIK